MIPEDLSRLIEEGKFLASTNHEKLTAATIEAVHMLSRGLDGLTKRTEELKVQAKERNQHYSECLAQVNERIEELEHAKD